jgi:hypothetical protein
MMSPRVWVIFSAVPIAIEIEDGVIDEIMIESKFNSVVGMLPLAQVVAQLHETHRVSAYPTFRGMQRHEVPEERTDGVVLRTVDGTLQRPGLRGARVLTMTMVHLVLMPENGRRNKSSLTVTGTQEQKKVELPVMTNIIHWRNTKI